MALFRLFITVLIFLSFLINVSGCYDDSFLDALQEEEDFVAPFDIVLNDDEASRTTFFPISDTGRSEVVLSGDDASYQNIPTAPRFTIFDNYNSTNDDVVLDEVTGLMWLKCTVVDKNVADTDNNCSGINKKLSWSQASETCSNLSYGGYDDWKLPTVNELLTILNFDNWPLVYSEYFPDTEVTVNEGYWTTTSKIFIEYSSNYESYDITDWGWIVFFQGGGVFGVNVSDIKEKVKYNEETGETTVEKQFVRCVRGRRK